MWLRYPGQALVPKVIGSFLFSEVPPEDQVAVEIAYTDDGRRVGQVRLSQRLLEAVTANPDYPRPGEMSIEAAFCYGVFLALKLGTGFVVTGDPSAWNPNWGRLIASGQGRVAWLDDRFG